MTSTCSFAVRFWPWALMINSSVYGSTTSYTAPPVSSHGRLGITRYVRTVGPWIYLLPKSSIIVNINLNISNGHIFLFFFRLCFLAPATTSWATTLTQASRQPIKASYWIVYGSTYFACTIGAPEIWRRTGYVCDSSAAVLRANQTIITHWSGWFFSSNHMDVREFFDATIYGCVCVAW